MKINIIVLACLCMLCSLVASETAQAQQYYYVITASFHDAGNAEKYMGYVRSKQFDAQKMLSKNKKLYYVYILKTTDKEEAVLQTQLLQQHSEFENTWLYTGTADAVVEKDIDKEIIEEIKQPSPEEIITVAEQPKADSSVKEPPALEIETAKAQPEIKAKGKLFRFTIQTPEGQLIPGEVHHVDYKRGHDLGTLKADKNIDMLKPAGKEPITLVCGIFGYKEAVKKVDYDNPVATEGAKQDERGAWVIPFTLERMKKGDASVMYHVSFYKDAVIMLPDSKTELDELVNMMKMNPHYSIKIHGHANGMNNRKIIDLGKSKNYFNITGSNEHPGSAKELSRLRAEAVHQYLVDNGIDQKRSTLYAWGGLNMLVPENSTSAKLNDRIEIEILKD